MGYTKAEILKALKGENVKFLRLQITDILGVVKNVEVPESQFEKALDGEIMFDGSSIAGWKSIDQSDMKLMPDASSVYMDPFYAEKTLCVHCDVVEPDTGEAYDRCPRQIAKKAEAYLKSSGIGDVAYFGPEAEFFIFDDVRYSVTPQ